MEVHERRRDRIELRETTRRAALVMVSAFVAGAGAILAVAAASLVAPWSLLVRAAAIAGVTLLVVGAVASIVSAVRSRSRRFVLELGPERSSAHDLSGSCGYAILRTQGGDVLGQTSDASLRIQQGRYWFTGRYGSGFRPALVLEARSGLVVAVPTIGPVPVRESSPDIETPTLQHLYPREFEYLARLAERL